MTIEPPRGEGSGPVPGQTPPGAPYASPYGQQSGQPYGQQPPGQPYAPQPGQQPYPPPQPYAPPSNSPYAQPYPPPQPPAHPDPGQRPSFDGPLPDAPADAPPLQWGAPLSAAAPAPKPPPPPTVSKLSIVTLVLGFLGGAGGLALITGLVALLRMRSTHKRGTALAVAGMLLGTAWLGLGAYVYLEVLSKPVARDASGVVVRRGDVAVTDLRVGDCIEKWTVGNQVGSVVAVPCTTNHDAEVFFTMTATGGAKYPGDAAVTTQATTQCLAKVKTGLKAADAKTAKVAFFKPVADSWAKGQKQITCVAKLPAPLGRSVRP